MSIQRGYHFRHPGHHVIAYTFFSILTFFIFHNYAAYGYNYEQIRKIEERAISFFGKQPPPGLARFSAEKRNKDRSKGNTFELESAVYLSQKGEQIFGFGLDITFADKYAFIKIGTEDMTELATTEFDVVTEKYVVECKSSNHPGRTTKIQQLEKERTMLRWMRSLMEDLRHNELTISLDKPRIITINSPSTCGIDVELYSQWMEALPIENPADRFIYIIALLATKELKVFFKNFITPEFANKLASLNIPFEDNIQMLTKRTEVPSAIDQTMPDYYDSKSFARLDISSELEQEYQDQESMA